VARLPGLYDRNYGAVTWTNDRVTFHSRWRREKRLSGNCARAFLSPWGERRYLVPVDDVVRLLQPSERWERTRGGVHGVYLLRKGDEKKPVSGSPKFQRISRSISFPSRSKAEVIAVGAYKTRPSVVDWKFRTLRGPQCRHQQGFRTEWKLLVNRTINVVESVRSRGGREPVRSDMTQLGG